MNKVVVSGITVVLFIAAVGLAYGLATEIIPVSVEAQVTMHHIPNSYDGRLGYVSVLNAAMPSHQGAELDFILLPVQLNNELQAIEELSAFYQSKSISQTQSSAGHGNCGGY